MPDLINPEYNNGKKDHILWVDELCASCKERNNCPLIQTLHRHTIMTYSGIHVSDCDLYDPDKESEHYIDPEERFVSEKIRIDALQQQLEVLNGLLERINGDVS